MKTEILKAAIKHDLDPALLFGLCMQESSLNPKACRFEPHYKYLVYDTRLKPAACSIQTEHTLQRTSWGLMQVMGAVIREQGFSGWLSDIVCCVDLQLEYGCRHLKKKIMRWGLESGILAYNSGTPRKGVDGKYVNAYYLENISKYSLQWSDYGK